jgi:hypothetical protein
MALYNNASGLLCNASFVWTYSVFEEHMREAITPSMYRYMAGYVRERLEGGKYGKYGRLEEEAVDAYFEIPINERIRMHTSELKQLRARLDTADEKVANATDFLNKNGPFDPNCAISVEVSEFMRGIALKYSDEMVRLQDEIHEEKQWRGGHEYGAEFNV